MSDLAAIAYRDVGTAEQARDKLFELQKQGLISIRDAAIVEAQPDGKVKLHQGRNLTGAGAAGGALWGGLIGLLFFAPFLGMALGAAGGAVAGKFTDVGVDDSFMKNVGSELRPGTAALFVLVDQVTIDKVAGELAQYQFGGKILHTSLSTEAEQHLRDVAQRAQAAARAQSAPAAG
ncbi:membrane protein [Actinocatenispora thailandica]|uniref:Membrane protein n=1 Tax=Actinocatenispora thailandica TaxID=227318 RepID=A0A7R7DPS9_9ACTN|nr:DUF1269 domain-containing protein [Actinocatenispora thailandica]BCJ35680.1 membrane protein [Actinocatenispora thailandica]